MEASADLEQDLCEDCRAAARRQTLRQAQKGSEWRPPRPDGAGPRTSLESLGKQGEAADSWTQAEQLGLSPVGSYAKTKEQQEQRGAESAQRRDKETTPSSVSRPRRPSLLHRRRNAAWSLKVGGAPPPQQVRSAHPQASAVEPILAERCACTREDPETHRTPTQKQAKRGGWPGTPVRNAPCE